MVVLDCTFRDGGYNNNWDFDISLANIYLETMEQAKVDAVEIGFRSSPKKDVGRFAKVTDYFIEDNLHIPKIEYFGVMINSGEYDYHLVKKLFCYADESPINLVRSATHFHKLDEAEIVLKQLKSMGYTVTLNLMQAADKSYDEIRDAAKKISEWKCVDILYLADSFGGMNHDTVNYAFKALREGWNGLFGFHGHNNKGQALNNTLEAIDIGVEWVDSTILGMGRGPGNTETEYLLNELNKRNFEFELESVYELAMGDFHLLKEKYNWGPSLPYYLSAEYNIHPTYVQELLNNYSKDIVLKAINYLKDKKCKSFDKQLLRRSIQ